MTLKALFPLLVETDEFSELLARLRRESAQAAVQAPEPATPYLVAALWREFRAPVIVLTPHRESARRLVDQLLLWSGEDAPVFHFAETESLPFERLRPDLGNEHQRLRSLAAFEDGAASEPPLVVASVTAAMQMTLERRAFRASTHAIKLGDTLQPGELLRRWADMGYEMEPRVEIPGTAARRGGIVDIYPVGAAVPARIEFLGDEVDSIRWFDPATQRSTGQAEEVLVTPARETLPALADQARVQHLMTSMDFSGSGADAASRILEELGRAARGEAAEDLAFYAGFFSLGSLFEYVPDNALLVVLRPGEVEETARGIDRRLRELRQVKEKRGEIPRHFPQAQLDRGRLVDLLNAQPRRVELSPWGVDVGLPGAAQRMPFEPAPVAGGQLERLWAVAGKAHREKSRVVIVSHHSERLREMAEDGGVEILGRHALTATPPPGSVALLQGYLREGFALSRKGPDRLVVLSDREVFGVTKERRRVRRRPARRGPKLSELHPGVHVVHVEHGIARFVGTTTLDGEDIREYLVLEYAENDKLYVPTEHLDRIQLYHGSGETAPRLTRLGTQEWTRARARARRATEQLAGELVALYAARSAVQGFSTAPDTPWQDTLEASFPYEETPDQMAALDAVKADLELPRPMDRLVCGDVGYGKTEIAIRAAFKVVQGGRQVAILVPTTVLAQQHSGTFKERLSTFPVRVEMLSRFRSDSEQRQVVKATADGSVDICIGTHRLLQQDVSFKDLGLVIVDEEHRFGVVHKERLKRMRAQVDVMTLSATPIPRTLHMSLAGVRDMSTMETPPEERLPIKTYISEESDDLIREAILREMDRGGQVFLLHNRVKNIDYFAHKVRELVPEATVRVGHGQMPEAELESVMADFTDGKFDVLVCTTIIESGIDLPNVNTLIVDRADTFGLSQLYQLRGRIGRGSNRAYAYLMVPRGKQLTEAAEQRLNTILAATELGAGFQIAMRDLEIRGAGNILGSEQSGHIAAIGFELYTRLLQQAVKEYRTAEGDGPPPENLPEFSTVRVDLGLDTRIPDWYVEDLAERLGIYRRLARVKNPAATDAFLDELRDRFGPVPKPVIFLLKSVSARILAERCNVDSVTGSDTRVVLALKESTGGARAALQKDLGRGVDVGHMQIRVEIDREDEEWVDEVLAVLEQLGSFRDRMLEMLATPAGTGVGDG
ncbi:MAG: transcription-repair coupling factor [Chloroflexi bacterium]|nr:transcription-repair coupling factor [Chloroflexota bacterium]